MLSSCYEKHLENRDDAHSIRLIFKLLPFSKSGVDNFAGLVDDRKYRMIEFKKTFSENFNVSIF